MTYPVAPAKPWHTVVTVVLHRGPRAPRVAGRERRDDDGPARWGRWQDDPPRVARYPSGLVTSYVPQARDTSEAVDRAVFDGLRKMTPLQRLQIAARASRALHRLSIAGLRQRHPEADEQELHRRAGATCPKR